MLGWELTVRHRIRGNIRVDAPITLEPGPDRMVSPMQLQGFSRTGLRITPPPKATRKPLEAILAAAGGGLRGLPQVYNTLRVFVLFLFDDLKALDHLEGEAHHAVILAQVLHVDGLLVVVDEHLVEVPAVVVEALSPLGHGLVSYLARLVGHLRGLLIPLTLYLPKESKPYSSKLVEVKFSEVELPLYGVLGSC